MKINGMGTDAKYLAYDGNHKIYLIEDAQDLKDAKEKNYQVHDIESLEDIYERSDELRFINNWKLTKTFAPQFETAEFERGIEHRSIKEIQEEMRAIDHAKNPEKYIDLAGSIPKIVEAEVLNAFQKEDSKVISTEVIDEEVMDYIFDGCDSFADFDMSDETAKNAYFGEWFEQNLRGYQLNANQFVIIDEESMIHLHDGELGLYMPSQNPIADAIEAFEFYNDLETGSIEVLKAYQEHGYFWKYRIDDEKLSGTFYTLEQMKEALDKNPIEELTEFLNDTFEVDDFEVNFGSKYHHVFESYLPVTISSEDLDLHIEEQLHINGLYQGQNQNYAKMFEDEIIEKVAEAIEEKIEALEEEENNIKEPIKKLKAKSR